MLPLGMGVQMRPEEMLRLQMQRMHALPQTTKEIIMSKQDLPK
jgi:hypothetical protein